MSAGQSSLEQMLGVYKWVVDDVVKNCREDFLNEGVDVQVLEDLKQLWENKLVISGALNRPKKLSVDPPQPKQKQQQQRQQHASAASPPPPPPPPPPSVPSAAPTSITSVIQQAPPKSQTTATAPVETRPSTAPSSLPPPPLIDTTQLSLLQPQLAALAQNVPGSAAASSSVATPSASSVYSLAGAMAAGVQPIMVSNPAAAGLLLQQRGLGMATYMMPYLPIVQQQQAALAALAQQQQRLQQQQKQNNPSDAAGSKNLEQSDGPPAIASPLPSTVERMQLACEGACKVKDKHVILRRKRRHRRIDCQLRSHASLREHESISQLDGPVGGSSSEESDEGSDDTDEDEEQQDPYEGYEDDDPLNSADDADSDEDDQALETDNTIVCQFEKVYRVRTKWKFALKDGIMNLKGYDYIFTKTTGEADW